MRRKVYTLPPQPTIRVMRDMRDASRDLQLTYSQLDRAKTKGLVFFELTNGLWMTEDRFTTLEMLKGASRQKPEDPTWAAPPQETIQ